MAAERQMFRESASESRGRGADICPVDDARGGHCVVHHGPVCERTESCGLLSGFCRGPDTGKKICASGGVAGVHGRNPSPDGRIRSLILPVAAHCGEDCNTNEGFCFITFFGLFQSAFACIPRGSPSPRFSLHPAMAMVRMARNRGTYSFVLVVS